MLYRRISFTVVSTFLLAVNAFGQVSRTQLDGSVDTLVQRIHFRAGSSSVDMDFRNNGTNIEKFIHGVNAILSVPDLAVDGLTIETGASPEGGLELNERLALERARSIRRLLLDRLPLSASQVKAYSVGIDWEGLTIAVRASSCRWRDQILEVIASTGVRTDSSPEATRSCQDRLKALDGGRAWKWMLDNLFPDLRQGAGTMRCVVRLRNPESTHVRDTIVVMHEWEGPDSEWVSRINALLCATPKAVDYGPKGWKHRYDYREAAVQVRTNLLLPLMDASVEAALSNRWSVEAGVTSPWMFRPLMNRFVEPQSECFQLWGASAGMRCYLGRMHNDFEGNRKYRMMGHSFGFLAGAGYYDLQHDWKGRQGEVFWTGVDYMYLLPLGKGGVRLGFSLGAGYAWTRWKGYEVHERGGRLIGNWNDSSWSGPIPVNVAVSLAVPFVYRNRKDVSHEE